jgi:hypothetical protein
MSDSKKSTKISVKHTLLNSIKKFLEYLIGRLSKMDKTISTTTSTQPGVGLNTTDPIAITNLSITEESLQATLDSYCKALNITEDQLTMEELMMICSILSIYAHAPKTSSC